MSEAPEQYLLQTPCKPDTLSTDLYTLQAHLPDLERLLTSLLVKVQLAQGKEPTLMTRAERRRR